MKFKPISKNRILANTPTKYWIRGIVFGSLSTTAVLGTYLIYTQLQDKDSLFRTLHEILRKKDSNIDSKNKPLQQKAYQEYLKEKKLFEQELAKETQTRLERLKQHTTTSTTNTTSTNVSSRPVESVKKEVASTAIPTESNTKQSSLIRKLAYYLSFGYYCNNSTTNKNTENKSETTK